VTGPCADFASLVCPGLYRPFDEPARSSKLLASSILSVFPAEILLAIVFEITDKSTLSSLSQTHSVFCELASPALYEEMTLEHAEDFKGFVMPVRQLFLCQCQVRLDLTFDVSLLLL
jgi:hypothetical protein